MYFRYTGEQGCKSGLFKQIAANLGGFFIFYYLVPGNKKASVKTPAGHTTAIIVNMNCKYLIKLANNTKFFCSNSTNLVLQAAGGPDSFKRATFQTDFIFNELRNFFIFFQ